MNRRPFSPKLRFLLLTLTLAFAVSCKKNITLFKPSTSDSTYADTDQNKLKWEYKQRERQLKKQHRRAARMAKHKINRDVQKVIQTARSYRGTPYRYGGTTRIGMDCSGLLCTSFRSIDVNLPRTSQEQSHFGQNVRPKDIRPGDLVFFSESRFSNKISHVGLVTDVKSDEEIFFIHASTRLGVIEDNLFSDHYQKIFIKAVRPKI
jgi:probable lipoprotein NlpC